MELQPVAIYAIVNKDTNKKYVGITGDLKRRWHHHKNQIGNTTYIARAIKKHGENKFEFTHIADAFSWQDACELEKYLINELNTKSPYGYNLTDGGSGCLGYKHSNTVKTQISELYKGSGNPGFKGSVTALDNITGKETIFVGLTDLKQAGFNPSHVYQCVIGNRKTHKNHTFKREVS